MYSLTYTSGQMVLLRRPTTLRLSIYYIPIMQHTSIRRYFKVDPISSAAVLQWPRREKPFYFF